MNSIDGLSNFRDIGGLPLVEGGTTVSGRLLRSDALQHLDEAGMRQLRAIPVCTIVDLRSPAEVNHAPEPDIPGIRRDGIPLLGGETERIMRTAMLSGTGIQAGNVLREMYMSMIRSEGRSLARVVTVTGETLSSGNGAELVHCTAGKDRTGIVIALILSVIGVRREAIVDDYAKTQENLAGDWFRTMLDSLHRNGIDLDEELQRLLILSSPDIMDDVLTTIDGRYGSVREYLALQGIRDTTIDELRSALAPDSEQANREMRGVR
ncbi:MAG: tyrosine-protein phosphatase [Bifidobacterium sp.]|uniref:Tyrosine-protein phosphatase n=1 Tax=Bifidobacterium fermentum TaxID=3059035 RepID=A0AB39U9F3_9BIFI